MTADTHRRRVLGGMSAAAIMALLRDNHAAAFQAQDNFAFATAQAVHPLIPGRLYRIGCAVRAERTTPAVTLCTVAVSV
jgi:hypothetical protein